MINAPQDIKIFRDRAESLQLPVISVPDTRLIRNAVFALTKRREAATASLTESRFDTQQIIGEYEGSHVLAVTCNNDSGTNTELVGFIAVGGMSEENKEAIGFHISRHVESRHTGIQFPEEG